MPANNGPLDSLPGSCCANTAYKSGTAARWAQAGFVICALSVIAFFRNAPQFNTFGITFASIVLEAFPFMLLGSLTGGLIEVFVSRERLTAWLPQRRYLAVFAAAGLGLIFPVCECAIVPVVRRLVNKGIPLGAAIGFLLGGPIVNPVVAASTAVAYTFDWKIVVSRLGFGYGIAVGVGILMDVLFTQVQALRGEESGHRIHSGDAECALSILPRQKVMLAINHAAHDFLDMGRFLVIGGFVAAAVQTLAVRHLFSPVASTPLFSILMMMIMAIVLNLCSEADAFVAASFRWTLVPDSAQLAFMVLGPMLDIKLLLMYAGLFRKRFIAALAGMTFVWVLAGMLLVHLVLK
jgi:uncharacterized membrane protein YraQ (UPF0718 family)